MTSQNVSAHSFSGRRLPPQNLSLKPHTQTKTASKMMTPRTPKQPYAFHNPTLGELELAQTPHPDCAGRASSLEHLQSTALLLASPLLGLGQSTKSTPPGADQHLKRNGVAEMKRSSSPQRIAWPYWLKRFWLKTLVVCAWVSFALLLFAEARATMAETTQQH